MVTPGQAGDSPMFLPLMAQLRVGRDVGRPVGLDVADYKNRNVIERRYCDIKQWRGLATRFDKHAVIYRAAVVLNAVIAWTRASSDMP